MPNHRPWTLAAIVFIGVLAAPCAGHGQTPGDDASLDRWEFTLGGRIGAPVGRLQVGEFFSGNAATGGPGTKLSLSTLGIHTSEAVEGSAAFYLTPSDAIRASGLYYFLRGDSTHEQSIVYLQELPGPHRRTALGPSAERALAADDGNFGRRSASGR